MYEMEEFGQGRWKSVYHVENLGLTGPIEQFTIWFDYGLYSDLTIETPPPLNTNWDEERYNPYEQPPLAPFDGYYDALVQQGAGIASGELVKGFSVSFEWLGNDKPSAQRYEIIDPVSFLTIDSGLTTEVPEPVSWLTFAAGCFLLRKRKQ